MKFEHILNPSHYSFLRFAYLKVKWAQLSIPSPLNAILFTNAGSFKSLLLGSTQIGKLMVNQNNARKQCDYSSHERGLRKMRTANPKPPRMMPRKMAESRLLTRNSSRLTWIQKNMPVITWMTVQGIPCSGWSSLMGISMDQSRTNWWGEERKTRGTIS